MSESDTAPLAPPVAEALLALGWPAQHPALTDAAPVAARGHNLVYVAPPAPAWAAPVLGGVLSGLLARRGAPVVALTAAAGLDEWTRVAARLARDAGLTVASAHTPARATRLLRSGTLDLVFLTPETAHDLVRRSAMKMDGVGGILFLWPEQWEGEDLLSGLLQDAGREIPRTVVTADRAGTAPLIERYCWRAPEVDLLGTDLAGAPAVRTAVTGWRRRLEALTDLVEQLDPASVAVWAADLGDRTAIIQALAVSGADASVTSGIPDPAALIIAYDLPTPARTRELAEQGDLVLLVPPGTDGYVSRLATRRRPVPLRGALDRARAALDASRASVAELLDRGPSPAAFFAVAPLLERYEASAVSAALYERWEEALAARSAPAASPPASAAGAKLWLGIGKRDAVTPNDLVAALMKDAGVAREAVGKVEIRESFSLVELAAGADPQAAAERLTGKTIRKRRLVARLDRGRTRE